jgi:hypothetical protein
MSRIEEKLEYRRSRLIVIEHLGGKCVSCGFSDHRALQFDHLKEVGLTHLRSQTWRKYHQEILNDTQGRFQLLCSNCNWIKRYDNEEHPRPRTLGLPKILGLSAKDSKLLLSLLKPESNSTTS